MLHKHGPVHPRYLLIGIPAPSRSRQCTILQRVAMGLLLIGYRGLFRMSDRYMLGMGKRRWVNSKDGHRLEEQYEFMTGVCW